jgi:hypothetical protein
MTVKTFFSSRDHGRFGRESLPNETRLRDSVTMRFFLSEAKVSVRLWSVGDGVKFWSDLGGYLEVVGF